jgi:putative colanic acid biosynthesis acetyltransferase WcaB
MNELFETIRRDARANKGDGRSVFVMTAFRVVTWLNERGGAVRLLSTPLRVLYRVIVIYILTIDLPLGTRIGPGLRILHGFGMVVNHGSVMGADCTVKHGCTLGVRTGSGEGHGAPTLGDRVNLGPGAQILGPVKIGDDVVIGAGSIVLIDLPSGCSAAGNPARILRELTAAEIEEMARTR